MAGYLDAYGAGDARREKRTKQIVLWALGTLIAAAVLFFYFRNFGEERAVNRFMDLLKQKKYQDAYALWTPETRKYYGPEKFIEDWGATGVYKNADALSLKDVDACGDGVVFHYQYPGTEDFGLWVERSSKYISFAGWPRCPGPHLQIMEFLKSRLGGGK